MLGAMSEAHFDHFDAATYGTWARQEIPFYDELQESIGAATEAVTATAILDLGTGTGETLARVLPRHPKARVIGVDESARMLDGARERLVDYDVTLQVADLLHPLPPGPFDLVVSALAVHHLDGPGKATLFARVAAVLRPGGRFVLGDVVLLPGEGEGGAGGAVIQLTDGWDKPSTVAEQLGWLEEAGFEATMLWQQDDLALFVGDLPSTGGGGPAH
jgi:tRNA (cmo5U34)-methyltransferase